MEIFMQLFMTFGRIGLFSFGGGYAMIPLMEKEVVRVHHWLTLPQMVDVIAVAEMTPGPVAINLATFVGFRTAGFWGAFCATIGVILPSFIIVLLITRTYAKFKEMDVFQGVLKGIRAMVVALIAGAAFVVAQSAIFDLKTLIIALTAFYVCYFTKVSPLILILAAGISGIMMFS